MSRGGNGVSSRPNPHQPRCHYHRLLRRHLLRPVNLVLMSSGRAWASSAPASDWAAILDSSPSKRKKTRWRHRASTSSLSTPTTQRGRLDLRARSLTRRGYTGTCAQPDYYETCIRSALHTAEAERIWDGERELYTNLITDYEPEDASRG